MRIIAAAIAIAALATPAFGQAARPNLGSDIQHPKDLDSYQRQQERESDYKSGLKKIPDQKASTDPWGNVRTDPKATQAKTPPNQKKAKTE
jgi:hypothetical protein